MGALAGIARHARSRGPIDVLDAAAVSVESGLAGDYRGAVKPGGRGRRQVSLIERADWDAAMADLGVDHHWSARRANLLVDGLDLPQRPGARLRIGAVLLEITRECDPCSRMEEIEPGLKAALSPDWRGGALAKVIEGGRIAVGDAITVEDDA
ncbi:MAG: MOSC domain-containing protein [Sphingomonas sp.]|nr:MOSC domain-containing protein [Sphingomonas sp.]